VEGKGAGMKTVHTIAAPRCGVIYKVVEGFHLVEEVQLAGSVLTMLVATNADECQALGEALIEMARVMRVRADV